MWLDVWGPDTDELQTIAQEYNLHATSIEDCLEPKHLPKFESFGDIAFIITRAYDELSAPQADTIYGMTRKVAIFIAKNFIITVHRSEMPFFTDFMKRWQQASYPKLKNNQKTAYLLASLLAAVIDTYEQPLTQAEETIDQIEAPLLAGKQHIFSFAQLHTLKLRAAVMRKMLRMTLDVCRKIEQLSDEHDPYFQNVIDQATRRYETATEVIDNTNHLLNMYLSISAHRTNDVMRLLTIFSVFFMPLTFVVGIYGMNFEYMPELKLQYGYPATILGMALIVFAIYMYFKRKKWL